MRTHQLTKGEIVDLINEELEINIRIKNLAMKRNKVRNKLKEGRTVSLSSY